MVVLARIGALLAALLWFVVTPVIVQAGVPFPSDAEYFLTGVLSASLGGSLAPVALMLARRPPAPWGRRIVALGLVICGGLFIGGILLAVAAEGGLGERAPGWIQDPSGISLIALYLWIGVASRLIKGPSRADQAVSWIGIFTAVLVLLPMVVSWAMQAFGKGLDYSPLSSLPILVLVAVAWLALPVWLVAIVIQSWPALHRISAKIPAG